LGLGNSLSNLGNVANAQGNYAEARAFHEQALAVRQGMGDTGAVAFTIFNLADVARHQADIPRARQLLDQCLGLFHEVGDKLGVGYALTSMGLIAHLQGRDQDAAAKFAEAIQIRQELGDKRGLIECLQGLAPVAHRLGDLDLAGRLFGAVEVHRELLDVPLPPTEEEAHTTAVAALQQAAGETTFRVAWSAGRAMTLDEAIAAAKALRVVDAAVVQPVRIVTPVKRESVPKVDFGLSEREREVLRHLALGETDREIAELLSISPRTVNVHVANLRGKLGVSSRAAVVALAHRHNLI
jgi:DNA-binding CsgD family transcriptional regulator